MRSSVRPDEVTTLLMILCRPGWPVMVAVVVLSVLDVPDIVTPFDLDDQLEVDMVETPLRSEL